MRNCSTLLECGVRASTPLQKAFPDSPRPSEVRDMPKWSCETNDRSMKEEEIWVTEGNCYPHSNVVGEIREMMLRGRESQVPRNLESETDAA